MEEECVYDLLMRGRRLLESGHPAQAALVLERARDREPWKGSILEALGSAYYGFGLFEKAARCFEDALEVDPTNDYAHYCLGLCYLKTSRRVEAGGHFKIAWHLRPREAYENKAMLHGLSRRADEAGGSFRTNWS